MKWSPKIIFILCLNWQFLPAQETGQDELATTLLEQVTTDEEVSPSHQSLIQWEELRHAPLDLNKSDGQDLGLLPYLSPLQISQILQYRQIHGEFISLYELQAVPGLDLQTIRSVLPYVRIGHQSIIAQQKSWHKKWKAAQNHYLLWRMGRTLEKQKGYQPINGRSKHLGSPWNYLFRYRASSARQFSFGLLAAKDAGEKWQWQPSQNWYGLGQYSFHLNLYGEGLIRQVMIGDYQLQLGQGVVFSGGFSTCKSAGNSILISRNTAGPNPFTSATEYGQMQGTAIAFQVEDWQFIPFYSRTRRDARLTEAVDNQPLYAEQVLKHGLHQDSLALQQRNTMKEWMAGMAIVRNVGHRLTLGTVTHWQQYQYRLRQPESLYQKYRWNGKGDIYHSLFFNYFRHNLHYFGEMAINHHGQPGLITGLIIHLDPTFDMSLHYRYYHPGFSPLQGGSMAENSTNQNETGYYWGFSFNPGSAWSMNGYIDIFRFPWLKYQLDRPSDGYEASMQCQYQMSRHAYFRIRYQEEEKAVHLEQDQPTHGVGYRRKQQIQSRLKWQPVKNLTLQSRLQWSWFISDEQRQQGFTIAQDVVWTGKGKKLAARVQLFDTENYDTRIYGYENNVQYAYRVPAFSGKGFRYYLVGKIKWGRHLVIEGKIARTAYFDRDKVGSGDNEIEGSHQTSLQVQCQYRF